MASRDITGETSAWEAFKRNVQLKWSRLLDLCVPYRFLRWSAFALLIILYFLRVFYVRGFYVVTYGMCIHLLYLTLLVITPLSEDDLGDESQLPHTSTLGEEFRPFIPRVQEFVVWCNMVRVVVICLCLTFLRILDIPVFWPILVLYFILLTATQIGGRIRHMIKHRYVPWNAGKPKFVPKP
ncbi:putative endoplasmatic reticulum retrieval protein [Trypanosoma vivax]|uniref:Protein RER1 n=1 Tax=Trypanosoma vivax (strain Y486) TaxID=1055687 RepID=G0TY54_TRYVY|nr:putative endoplasmatic reticulum retrieval protein [Trypanosoma vivax]CCC48899.1 putative endoplasmatic reticulum retrieval protein [Trypanosoma vivax Y486]